MLRLLLGDVLQPASTISTIVVHHTSRFTRDATHARVVKSKLRRSGVRVLSVSQELPDDPIGKLMEGVFECIDQYESELNGLRTSAAMREAVRQGFYPGGRAPYGYRTVPVEPRPGVVRHRLVVDEAEAAVVRELYSLYITEAGAKGVARALNQRGHHVRGGGLWNKDAVLWLIDQPAVAGTLYWGHHRRREREDAGDRLALSVEPIIDAATYASRRSCGFGASHRAPPVEPQHALTSYPASCAAASAERATSSRLRASAWTARSIVTATITVGERTAPASKPASASTQPRSTRP